MADEPKVVFGADASEVADAATEASNAVDSFGESVDSVRASMVDSTDDMTTGLKDLGSGAEETSVTATDAMEGMAEGVGGALKEIEDGIGSLTAMIRTIGSLGGLLILGDAIMGVADSLVNFVGGVDDAASHTLHLADTLQIPVQQLDALRLAMNQFGISSGTVDSILTRLARTMESASRSGSLQQRAFAALGISAQDVATHSNDLIGMLELMADRYAATSDGAAKLGAQQLLLRMGGADLVQFLDQGSAKIKDLAQSYIDSGAAMTAGEAKELAKQDDDLKRIEASWAEFKRQLVEDIGPAVLATLKAITEGMKWLADHSAQVGQALLSLVPGYSALEAASAGATAAMRLQLQGLTDDLQHLNEHAGMMVTRFGMMPDPNWAAKVAADTKAIAALTAQLALLDGTAANAGGALDGVERASHVLGGPDKPQVGAILPPATQDHVSEWKDALQQQIEATLGFFQESTQMEITYWSNILATEHTTQKEQIQIRETLFGLRSKLAHEELADETAVIDQKMALDKNNTQETLALEQQKVDLLKSKYGATSQEYKAELDKQVLMQKAAVDEENAIQTSHLTSQLAIFNAGIAEQKKILDQEVANEEISNDQKYASLVQLEDKSYQAQLAMLKEQLSITGQTEAYYRDLYNKLDQLDVTHNNNLIDLSRDAANADAQMWKDAFGEIGNAIDTMVDGVLQGTQSIWQAFGRALGNIILVWAKDLATMTVQFLAFKAATMLGWTQIASAIGNPLLGGGLGGLIGKATGAAGAGGDGAAALQETMNTLNTTVGSGTAATQLATVAQDALGLTSQAQVPVSTALITAVTALTAAVTANTAAQAGSSVGGDLSDVASIIPFLSSGASNIINPGLAFLHPGEMVVPADAANILRRGVSTAGIQGAGGNVANVTFQVQAMDSQDVMRFFAKHGRSLAKTVAGQFKDNPSTRPDF